MNRVDSSRRFRHNLPRDLGWPRRKICSRFQTLTPSLSCTGEFYPAVALLDLSPAIHAKAAPLRFGVRKFDLYNQIWADASITNRSELLLVLAIAHYSNEKNDGWAWPSIDTLAKRLRSSPRLVQFLVAKLVKSKKLEVRYGASRFGTNLYRLRLGVQNLHPGGEENSIPPVQKPVHETAPKQVGAVIQQRKEHPQTPKSMFGTHIS